MSGVRHTGTEDRYASGGLETNRRGAHRARPNPLLGALPMVGVGAVVLAVVVTMYSVLTSGGDPVAGQPGQSGSAPSSSSAQQSTPDAQETPADTGEPTDTGTDAEPTEEPAAEADKTVRIRVYNATNPPKNGLAGRVADQLKGDGWSGASKVLTKASSATGTVIYYDNADLEVTAKALAEDLGIDSYKESSTKSSGSIAVYLGNEFSG